MSKKSSMRSYSGLVQKYIGTAYDTVKYVADHMELMNQHITANIEAIVVEASFYGPLGTTIPLTNKYVVGNNSIMVFMGSLYQYNKKVHLSGSYIETDTNSITFTNVKVPVGTVIIVINGKYISTSVAAQSDETIEYIDELLDVDTTTKLPLIGEVLTWDGIANWVPVDKDAAINLRGTWDATTNTPDITTIPKVNGDFWIVSVDGDYPLPDYPDGSSPIIGHLVGDRIIWLINEDIPADNGWGSITPTTDAVTSIFGRVGTVVAQLDDYDSFYSMLGHTHTPDELIGLDYPVDSVFGRLGDILPLEGDYAPFYYKKTEHIYTSLGIADAFKPITLNGSGKLDTSFLAFEGLEFIGEFTPIVTAEYPDTTGVGFGSVWILVLTADYTWTTGDLFTKGKVGTNGDYMIWYAGDTGLGEWGLSTSDIDPSIYLPLDGSKPMEGNLNMANFAINFLSAGLVPTDAVNLSQLNTKSPTTHVHAASEITFDDVPTPIWNAADVQAALKEAYDDIQLLSGSIVLKGLWDATANVPDLLTIPKTHGEYWIVGIDGSTVLPQHPSVNPHVLPWEQYDKVIYLDDLNGTGFGQLRAVGDFVLKTGDTMLGDLIGSNGLSYNTVTSNADAGNIGKTSTTSVTDWDTFPVNTFGYSTNLPSSPNTGLPTAAVSAGSGSRGIMLSSGIAVNQDDSEFYLRSRYDSIWNPNYHSIFASTTRTSAQANTILDNANNGGLINSALNLSSGSNPDSVTNAGFYFGQNLLGAPNSSVFVLEVKVHSATDIHQELTYISGGIFTRSFIAGIWDATWTKIATSTDLAAYLPLDGSQPMTGNLVAPIVSLNNPPTAVSHATRKDYVDAGVFPAATTAVGDVTAFLGGGVGVEITMSELRDRSDFTSGGTTATGGWTLIGNYYTEWGNASIVGKIATVIVFGQTFNVNAAYHISVTGDYLNLLGLEAVIGFTNKENSQFSIYSPTDFASTLPVSWRVSGFLT